MMPIVHALRGFVVGTVRSRIGLQLKIVALRHQLMVYEPSIRRPSIRPSDRILWAWLARHWSHWRGAFVLVQPATVLAWQRQPYREHWARLSRTGPPGGPAISKELRELVREVCAADSRWGSSRTVGELQKLGIPVAKSTVEKYRGRMQRPPSPSWRAFLKHPLRSSSRGTASRAPRAASGGSSYGSCGRERLVGRSMQGERQREAKAAKPHASTSRRMLP